MRTIKQNLLKRLAAQAEEAEILGLDNVASAVTEQIVRHASSVRADDSDYCYPLSELKHDVQAELWSAILRTADYFDITHLDIVKAQEIVDQLYDGMMGELTAKYACSVGAYEPPVPGEVTNKVSIEVDE